MNTPFASNTLYYSESDTDIIRPKHQMAVPGLGVFIAPNAVARLFQLHDYTKCPPPGNLQKKPQRVLYPILRPNVMHSPRYYHLRQAARFKHHKRKQHSLRPAKIPNSWHTLGNLWKSMVLLMDRSRNKNHPKDR